jgi:MFS family permease
VTSPRPSLFRKPDFAKLWSAATISLFGTQVTEIAIPVVAILILQVSPFEVALVGTLQFLPFLLFTLPAGVWVDRMSRRRILIVADLGRAVMIASIPIAFVLGGLTIWQLYVVAFINGTLTVLFDIADMSYLPTVVHRDELVDANGKLQASASTAQVIGDPVGGAVVGLLAAPFALVLDAISYVASALLVFSIRRPERSSTPTPSSAADTANDFTESPASGASAAAEAVAAASQAPDQQRTGIVAEVRDGLRFVVRNRFLRHIAPTTGVSNLFSNISFSMLPVFIYRDLGLTPQIFGLIGGCFGIGALLGAATSSRVANRFGIGTTIIGSIAIGAPMGLLVPLATRDTALLLIGGGGIVSGWANVVYNVSQVSLRQAITPERMLGRMNATMRFIVWGTIPVGTVIGGLIATAFGVMAALWVGAIGGLFPFLFVFFSPVRGLQKIPEPEPEGGAGALPDETDERAAA